jgi:hypothetical protein
MRSALTFVRFAALVTTTIIAAASSSLAAPVNINSSSNAGAAVTTTTNVTGSQQSYNGSLVDVGTQATNNAAVGINQNTTGSGLNIGSNQNANVKGYLNTKKSSTYYSNNGSAIRSTTFVTGKSQSNINQKNTSALNINSPQNAEIGFGTNVDISGNNYANNGSSITRGIGIDSTHNTTINQDSGNPFNNGASQNANVQSTHNFTVSGNNTATNGGVINSQTVSSSTSNIVINKNR